MSNETQSGSEPVIIKKYANRRLYNTDTSSYVTLDDLAEMVRAERDFVVYDAKSGEDLTRAVLTQIIVDQESRGQNLLPVRFLQQLIRFYGDSIERLVPSYLEFSLDSLTRDQDKFRKQFANSFGTGAFDAMQEQAKQNIAMFEKALGMFSPFPQPSEKEAPAEGANNAKSGKADTGSGGETENGARDKPSEIADLKAELNAIQEKLERISGESR